MRQVFSSHRLENVEAVARLLRDEDIEVRITDGRSFRSGIRGGFSYRESASAGPRPAVWVIRSDDQPRARQLLREAGLLEEGASARARYLSDAPHALRDRDLQQSRKRANRFRFGLIALVAVFAAAIVFKPTPPPHNARPAGPTTLDPHLDPVATVDAGTYRIATPPALAAAVAAREQARLGGVLCLAIDGEDAPEAALSLLRAHGIDAAPLSACAAADALRVDVDRWETDGSGSGTVGWSSARGTDAATAQSGQARRDGDDWHLDDTP